MPRDWKPMPSVGPGVVEGRVRLDGAYRLMYVAKFTEGMYVLHASPKKSQKTEGMDIEVARPSARPDRSAQHRFPCRSARAPRRVGHSSHPTVAQSCLTVRCS